MRAFMRKHIIHNGVIDTFASFVCITGFVIAHRYAGVLGETIFLLVWLLGTTWFGFKHPRRQLYIVAVCMSGLWIMAFFVHDIHRFLLITRSTLILCVSVGIYFSVTAIRDIHRSLNERFVLAKEKLNVVKQQRAVLHTEMNYIENDNRMMNAIYEVTKKMVAAMTLDQIVHMCVSFFNRYFSLDAYCIFQYDSAHKVYNKLYSSGLSELSWSKLQWMLHENEWLVDENGYMALNENDAAWTQVVHNVPPHARSFMVMPLTTYGERVNGAILFSTDPLYFKEYIIKYLATFSRQMALGVGKVLLYEDVRERSRHDSLTSLFTRTYWEERFEQEIKKTKRYGNGLAVLMIDIDFFKKYNDKYGHLIGDEVLKMVAQSFVDTVRDTDIIGRYGGEEFVILMHISKREEAYTKAEQIRAHIENKQLFADGIHGLAEERITVSIGIACYPFDAITKNDLVAKADQAMYYGKRNGRNMVVDHSTINQIKNH